MVVAGVCSSGCACPRQEQAEFLLQIQLWGKKILNFCLLGSIWGHNTYDMQSQNVFTISQNTRSCHTENWIDNKEFELCARKRWKPGAFERRRWVLTFRKRSQMKTVSQRWNSFVCAAFWGNQVLFWGWKWNFRVLTPKKTEKSQQLHLCSSSTHLQVVTGKAPARRRGLPAAPALSMSTLDAQRSPLQQSVRKKPKKACRTMRRFRGEKRPEKDSGNHQSFHTPPKGDKPYPCVW